MKFSGSRPIKSLGQNFLTDSSVVEHIIDVAGDLTGKSVLEIGPGHGALTKSLLSSKAHTVTAVEYDRNCVNKLHDLIVRFSSKFNLIEQDAMQFNEEEYFNTNGKIMMISNLPYNISVSLLLKWLERIELFECLVLMFQKEVAHRITAKPHTPDFGTLSVLSQYLCDVKIAFNVPARSFYPQPKVESSVVIIKPRENSSSRRMLYNKLKYVCGALFNQRRKMIRAALKNLTPDVESLCDCIGIRSNMRAEDLTVENFEMIAKAISHV